MRHAFLIEEAAEIRAAAQRRRRIKLLIVGTLAFVGAVVNFLMSSRGTGIFWHVFVSGLVVFAVSAIAAYVHGSKLIGKAVGKAIMEYDRKFIGVDVHVGAIDVRLFTGRIVIQDFEVENPAGYKATYLFRAQSVSFDIDMKQLLASRGREIVIEELSLLKIDAIIEHDGYINALSKTNLQTVLDFMSKKEQEGSAKASAKSLEPTEEDLPQENCPQRAWRRCCGKRKAKAASGRKTIVRKVQLIDIGVKIANKFGQLAQNISHTVAGIDAEAGIVGVRVAVADMEWENFSEEFGIHSTIDVLNIIIRSLLKTILANMAGRGLAEALF
jgi:hypothetical protein